MKMLYGNFDAKAQRSLWSPASFDTVPGALADAASIFHRADPPSAFLTVLSTATIMGADGKPEFQLFTYAEPTNDPNDCHACGVLVGGAKFQLDGTRLTLKTHQPFAFASGSWGKPPSARTVIWGNNLAGVETGSGFTGQGYTVSSTTLHAWRDGQIEEIYTVNTHYDNSGAMIGEDDKRRMCQAELKFGKQGPNGANEFTVTTTLFMEPDMNKPSSTTTELFVYDGQRYVNAATKAPIKAVGCEGA